VLELVDIHKSYGRVQALAGVNLQVRPGEIVALTGPSGAGKTTTLHIAAGILSPSRGKVLLGGRDVTGVHPWKRDVALVQETYALYPHLSVRDNIAFPLRSPQARERVSDSEIEVRIRTVAEILEIGHLLPARIQHLSGGQRQRVALARALVRNPDVFLLDEPIAHLDAKLRHWLRGELRRRLVATERPILWATPDGKEALSVADRVAVIVGGRIVQCATPREIFLTPATARVAEIASDPPINLLEGSLDLDGPRLWVRGAPDPVALAVPPDTRLVTGRVLAGVRPSDLRIGGDGLITPARVMAREFTTRETVVSVRLGNQLLRVLAPPFAQFRVDEEVNIGWEGARLCLFEADGERRLICEARVRAA
jgi:multiple sugar transport system ATP-binding protein